MRVRRRYVPLAAVLGLAVAVLPAVASSETSSTVEAVNQSLYVHKWLPAQVAVPAGGAVALRNSTAVAHGVEWVGGPTKPECSSGVPVGNTPAASGAQWSGTCTFKQAGTYTFYCTVHGPEMTGTITVNANGTTTTTTTATSPTSTTTTTTPTTPTTTTPAEPPSGSPLLAGPSLRFARRGAVVDGSLDISGAGAGERLEVNLLARSASLAVARHSTPVRVGRFLRRSVPAGRVSFAVKLNGRARRALERHRRLALVVQITLTPAHGGPFTVKRALVAHT